MSALIAEVDAALGAAGAYAAVRTLALVSSRITVNACAPLAVLMRRLTNLQRLDLSCNPIGSTALGLLVPALPVSLEELDLSAAGLDPNAAGAVRGLLASLPVLRVLRLSRNRLWSPVSAAVVAAALARHPSLATLDVSDTGLCDETVAPLIAAVARQARLRALNVGANFSVCSARLLAALPACRAVDDLGLAGCRLFPVHVDALARAHTLRRLDLTNCHLPVNSLRALCALIEGPTALAVLNLPTLAETHESLDFFMASLASNRSLVSVVFRFYYPRRLNHSSTAIPVLTIGAIGHLLALNETLKSLEIAPPSTIGLASFEAGLLLNATLRRLCFSWSPKPSILRSLRLSSSIHTLSPER